jgi:hypothetical protein
MVMERLRCPSLRSRASGIKDEEPETFMTVGDKVSGTYWGMLCSRECRVPAEAVEGQW